MIEGGLAHISPGFTGKELQELQGLRPRVAERVGEFECWRPWGHTNDKTLWEGEKPQA